jgi:hypothetical protein
VAETAGERAVRQAVERACAINRGERAAGWQRRRVAMRKQKALYYLYGKCLVFRASEPVKTLHPVIPNAPFRAFAGAFCSRIPRRGLPT